MDKNGIGEHLSNAEVYKMADTLLRRHGRDAVIVAAMRAGELLDAGDMDGYRTWKRLVMLVDGMSETECPEGVSVH